MFVWVKRSVQNGVTYEYLQVLDAVNVPVVAAGGIGDGRGLLAALSLL